MRQRVDASARRHVHATTRRRVAELTDTEKQATNAGKARQTSQDSTGEMIALISMMEKGEKRTVADEKHAVAAEAESARIKN